MSIARRALALAICFLIVVRRGEPSLLTASRAILLDVLIVGIGMVNGCLLQHLTN